MSTDNKDRHDQSVEYKSRRMFNLAAVFLILSFLLFLCQLINFGVFNTSASGSDSLPISIRANSQADYSRDATGMSIPPISENILNQIILDMPATGDPRDRIATLEVALSQPVPTMTPNPLFPPPSSLRPLRQRPPCQRYPKPARQLPYSRQRNPLHL